LEDAEATFSKFAFVVTLGTVEMGRWGCLLEEENGDEEELTPSFFVDDDEEIDNNSLCLGLGEGILRVQGEIVDDRDEEEALLPAEEGGAMADREEEGCRSRGSRGSRGAG